MSELERIAETFSVSKPVFVSTLKWDDDTLEFELKDRHNPIDENESDPVRALLAQHWSEVLDRRTLKYTPTVDVEKAFFELKRVVETFYLQNSPLKNPKQTKLYKWLSCNDLHVAGYKHPTVEGFIALFRYMHSEGLQNARSLSDDARVKNIIAILELMREKYEGK